jgi:hypothetical protein
MMVTAILTAMTGPRQLDCQESRERRLIWDCHDSSWRLSCNWSCWLPLVRGRCITSLEPTGMRSCAFRMRTLIRSPCRITMNQRISSSGQGTHQDLGPDSVPSGCGVTSKRIGIGIGRIRTFRSASAICTFLLASLARMTRTVWGRQCAHEISTTLGIQGEHAFALRLRK